MRKDNQSKGPVQVDYQHYRLHASVIPATFQLAQTIKNDHFLLGPCGPKYSPKKAGRILWLNPQPTTTCAGVQLKLKPGKNLYLHTPQKILWGSPKRLKPCQKAQPRVKYIRIAGKNNGPKQPQVAPQETRGSQRDLAIRQKSLWLQKMLVSQITGASKNICLFSAKCNSDYWADKPMMKF